MIVVVDASVALKWFFRARGDEAHVEPALAILDGIEADRLQMVQPPHFMAEVAAVLAREKAYEAIEDLTDLQEVDWEEIDPVEALYATALELSVRFQHHLFDTLYHAAALHLPQATLITADRRYYERAAASGGIAHLADFASG